MNDRIKNAVNISQRAQRNYDLSQTVPDEDIKTLIHAATKCPSKQNEVHYKLHVYTDKNIIREIYNCTKKFTLIKNNDFSTICKEENGSFHQDDTDSVHNSQILANVLFVYEDDQLEFRGGTNVLGMNPENVASAALLNEQKNISIGVSIGELILSASLLGYRTGVCSALNDTDIQEIIGATNRIKILVGVGFENTNLDRRLHAETLNKNVPENFRNGELNEQWKFPSFEKEIKVTFNEHRRTTNK